MRKRSLKYERLFVTLSCVDVADSGQTLGIAEEICLRSAQIHAETAHLSRMVAKYDSSGDWAGIGVRSCAHWLTIAAGFDLRTSSELIRVGHALEQLPAISEAFAEGRLSFDKVRAVTRVAVPEDEAMWLEVALQASGSQLARICRSVRSALDVNDPRRADDELAHRGVRWWWRDDGMFELMAVLTREDGAVVVAAIDAVAKDLMAERGNPDGEFRPPVPEKLRRTVLEADGLVRVCEQHVSATSPQPLVAPTRQVVIHVDESVLRDRDAHGRSHIEDGSWLSPSAARWQACDADTVTVTERHGVPIDVGRARRVIPPRLRLALHARDRGCRYPGCGVPAKRCEGHHWWHWVDGGPTDLCNCLLLCRFHHRRHHEGKYDIEKTGPGEFVFVRTDGTPIVTPLPVAATRPLERPAWITPATPVALSQGEPSNHAYVVSVLADAAVYARAST